ncbi:hypothetical protein FEE95_00495 [Maribacter algarum]|uniref:Lipoprotein n=1 Tax=Maribacter algarum (ex Zhang et al. 2020) TaxID=2578118 RepID=A0A5S3PSL9_9FLAO|nr:hypothetical protein [Maribacter algarum]TMM57943.1 hypothetical protein FEE95_00495 [Maribacter algarum]
MKNLKKWFPLVLVFLFVFTLSSCNEECPPCEDPTPVKAPAQIVEVDDAKKMYDTYTIRRKPLIRRYEDSINRGKDYNRDDKMKQQKMQQNQKENAAQVDSFPVARYVYYDYKTIKDYLTYLEQEAKNQGIEISTLRFYFSNYPEGMVVKDALPRQNSIFIMPTITQDNQTYGYFLDDKEQLLLLNDDLKVSKTSFKPKAEDSEMKASLFPEFKSSIKAPSYSLFEGGKSYILNEGGVRPPPYN